jgi:putative membrane-bound dehydrogenase-like protein
MSPKRADVKPFEYVDVGKKIPNYVARQAWGTQGEAFSKMQLPLEPAESLKHFVTPIDFEVRLFAAEPWIRKPICMNWDERGRLWIAETIDYPNNRQRAGEGNDRIVICEDTDGDGVADKFTVFADKLSIPTGFTFYKGGVIVVQAPDTLYLKDTDGGGVANERRVLFTGWGTSDSHAGPSNLRWGFDNWVYGICGYAGFDGEVGGERSKFKQGFFRFKPDGSKLEFLRSTDNNSWGLGFSEDGLVFGSTANGNPSVYLPIPNRYYEQVRGWSASGVPSIAGNPRIYPITDKVRQVDWHGHFTAAAGQALYTARAWPREYWNRAAFVCEPTGHLVATFQLERHGSDFVSHNAWNLLASDDEWSAPIMAEVGPDGNVWVIDWYNYIVQHNPTPRGFKTGKGNAYETDLRDKTHGRVYSLVMRNARHKQPFSLEKATPAQLVAALRSDNLLWRMHAQRLLVERGQRDVAADLVKLAGDRSVDEMGLNPGAIHALWTSQGLGTFEGEEDPSKLAARQAVLQALRHPSAAVRRTAVLVMPRDTAAIEAIINSGLLSDPDAHVRLATVLALAEMPTATLAGESLAIVLERPENAGDRWIPDAATSAGARHALPFLRAVAARKSPNSPRVREVVKAIAEHVASGGDVATLDPVLASMAAAKDPAVAELMLAGFAKGWPRGKAAQLQHATEAALEIRLKSLSPAGKAKLLSLAPDWGSTRLARHAAEAARALLAAVSDDKGDDAARIAAARDYLALQPHDLRAAEQVLDQITPRASPELAVGLIDALAASTSPKSGSAVVARIAGLPPSARTAAMRFLLSRADATRALLDAIDERKLQIDELALDQKEALTHHPDKDIVARARALLARGGVLPSADRQKVIDELMPITQRTGDAARGKLVFEKNCATCHMHNGKGATIAPDLTGVAAHPKAELLVDIMDPSRSVEGNYRVYTVTLKNGRVLSGLLASETKTSVEIVDAQAQKHQIQRDTLEEIIASNKSLMPDGFEKQLSQDELADLLEFLTQRGKYVPLSLEKAATAISTLGMFYSKDSALERLVFPDWSPKTYHGVPFQLVDPRGTKARNVILIYSPNGSLPPTMPKSIKLPYSGPAKAIHLLSGVSGWGFPRGEKGSVSLIVRLHYADGTREDHPLKNGEHFADYIHRVDVPRSEFAFALRGQQVRYLAVNPKRAEPLCAIEFVKGEDATAPVVMAVTVETRP